MRLLEYVKSIRGTPIRLGGSKTAPLELLPPLAADEINTFAQRLPCPLPDDVRETLAFTSGITNPQGHDIDFAGGESGPEDILPHAIRLTGDSCGNGWMLDLTPSSTIWGPVFFACHDPPVMVYQAATLLEFLEQVVLVTQRKGAFEIDHVSNRWENRIYEENPGIVTRNACLGSSDSALRAFAETLDEDYLISDLRNARLGDGFSWGRFGADTIVKRFGYEYIFAYKRPPKKSLWQQLFGR